MMIYFNGQDINKIILAVLKEGVVESDIVIKEVEPEGYLKAFRDFLKDASCSLDQIKKIFVVVGPGSATALRSSLAIVNTLAFANGIELVEVAKEKSEQDIDTVKKLVEQGLHSFEVKNVLMPKYEHEPRITISTKDALRRKKKSSIK